MLEVLTSLTKEAPVEAYAERDAGQEYLGRQYVGIDLHRRRSVIVRTDAGGQVLEKVQILNDAERLGQVLARAGEHPEVVIEATYGWYWAVDTLQGLDCGPVVHLAHPLGVKAFEYRRVKNDERDAIDLADLLRMGRLPEAWIAPPATRELRELVRHRAKLVGLRSRCKAQVHAVLAKCGIAVVMSDLFGLAGTALLDELAADGVLPKPYAARIASLRRVIDLLDFEIDTFASLAAGRLRAEPGYTAVQTIPGVGPVLAAVFVAEIGDITRFPTAGKLTCWAGMTPKHRESDIHVRRGRITKQGSRMVRWAAVESVQRLPARSQVGAFRDQVAARRGKNIAAVAAARRQLEHVYHALRDGHVRALHPPRSAATATTPVMDLSP
jgi:transposase